MSKIKNFFTNNIIGFAIYCVFLISILFLINFFDPPYEITKIYIFILIYVISMLLNIIIMRTLFFIMPLSQKYDILVQKVNIKRIILIDIFAFILIIFLIYKAYFLDQTYFIVFISSLITSSFFLYFKYKKYDIFNLVDNYSFDFIDWNKIINLKIDINKKKEIFKIHCLNYDCYVEEKINE